MPMSKSNNIVGLLLLTLGLAACQSGPESAPQPEPVIEPTPEIAAIPETVPEPVPEAEPEPVDFNQQFYQEAVASLKQDKPKLALELLMQVSSDAPNKPFVFTNLGLAYLKLQQADLAEKAFMQALERDGDDAVAHNHLGILLRQKGEFENARQHYQRAIKSDSDYALAWLNLGILYDIYLQDLGKALQHYQKYQALTGDDSKRVNGWILDIERRLKSGKTSSKS